MDSWLNLLWPTLLVIGCTLAWLSNFVTLPGNWIAAVLVLIYFVLVPQTERVSLGIMEVVMGFCLAGLGEVLEFAAAAVGAKRAGGSTRATILAIVGSMIGAVFGAVVGVPVPVVGTIIGALLFGALGATSGAMLGEWMGGKTWTETLPVGNAAFWGRLLGTVGKVFAGMMILLVVCIGVCF